MALALLRPARPMHDLPPAPAPGLHGPTLCLLVLASDLGDLLPVQSIRPPPLSGPVATGVVIIVALCIMLGSSIYGIMHAL